MKIGIDIGGSHVAVAVLRESSKQLIEIVEKYEQNIDPNQKEKIELIEDFIVETINGILSKNKMRDKVKEIGIAIPGKIEAGVVIYSPNLKIENYSLEKHIREKTKYTEHILIRNDAKCAAMAEKNQGALKEYSNAVFMCLGTGIGGAVMYNNHIISRGAEFGHMVTRAKGLKCNCGRRGCFEKYASMKSFKEEYIKATKQKNIDGVEILKQLNKNQKEDVVANIINQYIDNLAIGMANIIRLYEPEVIVVGGSFVHFDKIFTSKLKKAILENKEILKTKSKVNIKMAELRNDAGIIGSIIR